ncbi:MAG: TetR/AcrR family transcriptional regulator, partial [Cellulosilyticaceae bacterium]
ITVDEICSRAQISRGTFFNYFSTKDHVFHYFLRIFTIRIALRIKQWPEELSFEEKIREIYKWFNEETQYSRFVDSYINFLLTVGEENNEMKLIDAEFVYFFSGIEEEEYTHYNGLTLNTLFQEICKKAQGVKEIGLSDQPKELANLFAGVLVASYITDKTNGDIDHLTIFDKIWK